MVAVVVEMPVRHDGMIDGFQFGDVADDVEDSIPIAAIVVGIAGIHEDRLADRRHNERGGSSFDVDEVEVETPVLLPGEWPARTVTRTATQIERRESSVEDEASCIGDSSRRETNDKSLFVSFVPSCSPH